MFYNITNDSENVFFSKLAMIISSSSTFVYRAFEWICVYIFLHNYLLIVIMFMIKPSALKNDLETLMYSTVQT